MQLDRAVSIGMMLLCIVCAIEFYRWLLIQQDIANMQASLFKTELKERGIDE